MKIKPCIIGLGYVGLPLFVRLQKKFQTVGFDVNKKRVKNLRNGQDTNGEYEKKELKILNSSIYSSNVDDIKKCNFFIIAVPTPIYRSKKPNLSFLIHATNLVAKYIKKNDIFFLESTVYPNVTEKVCIPIIEKKSKLKNNEDFYVGYSPERINPGDKKHSVEKIHKIVALPCNKESVLQNVKKVYSVLSKKIIFSKSIMEAETSKVIENIQRDLNIALMNEIFLICNKLKINFSEVLKLALSKWNFHSYRPGLVGGHCLPVDPYYFSFIAKKNKINANLILSGRKINNGMENFVINKIKKIIKQNKKNFKNAKILLVGATYKSNVSDIRNSLSLSIFRKFKSINKNVVCYDPFVNSVTAGKFEINKDLKTLNYEFVVFLVNHNFLKTIYDKFLKKKKKVVIIDIFNFFNDKK